MSSRSEGFEALALPDLERRSANMVRFGVVEEIDFAQRRVKVRSGELLTAWLPWSAGRSGAGKRRWDAPEVGEQVVMLAPAGDLTQAAVLPGFYQDAYDAPSSNPDQDRTEYGDGTVLQYDRGTSTLLADLGGATITATPSMIRFAVGGVSLTITAGGLSIEGNISQDGSITSSGDHVAGSISLQNHTHSGVDPGPGSSGPPQ